MGSYYPLTPSSHQFIPSRQLTPRVRQTRIPRVFYNRELARPRRLLDEFNAEFIPNINNTVDIIMDRLQTQTQTQNTENMECSICYDALQPNTIIQLQCKHYYCKSCIQTCLNKQYTTCALCRAQI